MEEQTGIAVRALLELDCQIKILVIFTGSEIAVAEILSVLGHEIAYLVNTCAHASEQLPSVKILSVEEFDLLTGLAWQFLDLDIPE